MEEPIMDASAMRTQPPINGADVCVPWNNNGGENGMLGEDAFHQMVYLEKKRSERSGKPFLLMRINIKGARSRGEKMTIFNAVNKTLSSTLRETDIRGWFEQDFIIGVIFTEIGATDVNRAHSRIHEKIYGSLRQELSSQDMEHLVISYQVSSGLGEEYPVACILDVQPWGDELSPEESRKRLPGLLNSWLRQRCFLLAVDLLIITLAQFLSIWIRLGELVMVPETYTGAYAFSILLYPAALYVFDLYNMEKAVHWRWLIWRTALAVSVITGLSAAWFYLVPFWEYGRGVLAISSALIFVMLTVWRFLFRSLLQVSESKIPTLVLGAGESGMSVYRLLSQLYSRYKVVGFLDDDPNKQGMVMGSPAVLGTLDMINEVACRTGARAAVLALPRNRPAWLTRKILEARLRGLEIIEMPTIYEKLTEKVPVPWVEDQWLLFSGGFDLLSGDYVRKIKRIIDFFLAAALLFLTAPLMGLTAFAIWAESRRPVFYRQERVGRGGRVFTVTKFRSMISDAESKGAQWATKRDPRVTRVGRWIRILRIDELPQIWNVFKGDMSIIGPRPERPEFVKELEAHIPYYSVRHTVTPGITGWAQVKYPYGASFDDAVRKLEYDLYYIKNMSLLLDLKIILRTIGVVLLGEGAR